MFMAQPLESEEDSAKVNSFLLVRNSARVKKNKTDFPENLVIRSTNLSRISADRTKLRSARRTGRNTRHIHRQLVDIQQCHSGTRCTVHLASSDSQRREHRIRQRRDDTHRCCLQWKRCADIVKHCKQLSQRLTHTHVIQCS